jgi:hypothetical protein
VESEVINMFDVHIDNIYVQFGLNILQQIIDIPIGTKGATLLADDKQNNKKAQHRKLKRCATQIHRKPGMNPGAREGQAVPASYNTPTMLLI